MCFLQVFLYLCYKMLLHTKFLDFTESALKVLIALRLCKNGCIFWLR